ncbi:hypothetical protein Tco_0456157, partial [Tanacetum coccineum]
VSPILGFPSISLVTVGGRSGSLVGQGSTYNRVCGRERSSAVSVCPRRRTIAALKILTCVFQTSKAWPLSGLAVQLFVVLGLGPLMDLECFLSAPLIRKVRIVERPRVIEIPMLLQDLANGRAGVPALPTFTFITSSETASLLEEGGIVLTREWPLLVNHSPSGKSFEMNVGQFVLCANMIDHFTPPAFFKTVRGMEHEQLFTEFNVSAARNLSLSSDGKGKRLRFEVLNVLQAKEESAEVTQLRAQVSGLEATKNSLRGEVHELEISSTDLREKLEMYERSLKQLEEFSRESYGPLGLGCAFEIRCDFTGVALRFRSVSIAPSSMSVRGADVVTNHWMKLLVATRGRMFDDLELSDKRMPVHWDIMDLLDRVINRESQPLFVAMDNCRYYGRVDAIPVVIIPHAEPSVSIEDYDKPDSSDVVPENATLGSESEGRIDVRPEVALIFHWMMRWVLYV